MSKKRISQRHPERCLLTEIAPYETPILFSNWGSYNYCRNLQRKSKPPFLQQIFKNNSLSIPYKFRIRKDSSAFRNLSLIHPKNSAAIAEFYQKYDILITKCCTRSLYTLRAPTKVAKFYTTKAGEETPSKAVEEITADTAYASSYFRYNRYSHLYKYFDSDEFTELEKRFQFMLHADIVKCFPSIYTHSVSWAVKGKTATKESLGKHDKKNPPFDVAFDLLMQEINYKETNGIPVGPELSRIFAEVILQSIDTQVLDEMRRHGLELGESYWCCRYIDDYFFFFNTADAKKIFLRTLAIELEKFKLYLSDTKGAESNRPFISDVSVLKLKYSQYLSDLSSRKDQLRADKSHIELNKLRAVLKGSSVPFSSISNFLMASLIRQIKIVSTDPDRNPFNVIYVYIDLIFHALRMDIRVSSSYKIAGAIVDLSRKIQNLPVHERNKIYDKVAFELRGALDSANNQESAVECMNLLIAQNEISDRYPISPNLLTAIISRCRNEHRDEYSDGKRLTYFEIVSLLYVMRGSPNYTNEIAEVIKDANSVIGSFDPRKYAESAYLLIDLLACPFLDKPSKDKLALSALKHEKKAPTQLEVDALLKFISRQRWYFDWNQSGDLKNYLKKKQLLLSY